jgi:hypothetical protein
MKPNRWPICLLLGCGLALLAPAWAPAAEPVAANAGPMAVAPAPTFTFDPVYDGETIQHDFPIHNRGTADLRIQKVNTG